AALGKKLGLTEADLKRIKLHFSAWDICLVLNIGPQTGNPEDPDTPEGLQLAEQICALLWVNMETFWKRPEPRYDGDNYGLVWRHRFIHPNTKLFSLLDIPVPPWYNVWNGTDFEAPPLSIEDCLKMVSPQP